MENSSNKPNKLLIIIIVILSICVVGLVTLVATTLLVKPNHRETPSEEKEIVKKEIKDIDIITDLSTKIDAIMSGKTNQYYKSFTVSGYRYRYNLLKQPMSEQEKQAIVLDNVAWETIPESDYETFKNTSVAKDLIKSGYPENHILTTTKQISLEKASSYSETFLGEKITKPLETVYSRCPNYSYDATTKNYYFPIPQCGGINMDSVYTYKSKFEENLNEAYVYVNFAYSAPTGTNSVLEKYTIYKDFDIEGDQNYGSIKYKDVYKSGLDKYESETFVIDDSNYTNFKEYKFTFKKDKNNNYYFVKVEESK